MGRPTALGKRTRLGLGIAVVLAVVAPGQAKPEAPQPALPVQPPGSVQPDAARNASEKELLDKIRQLKMPQWRSFGVCRYGWTSWRVTDKGVRTTSFECGTPAITGSIGVHCPTLRVSRRIGDGDWEAWRLPLSIEESPSNGGEDLMVASLCANARATPAAATPASAPTKPAKPAAAPPARPKAKAP